MPQFKPEDDIESGADEGVKRLVGLYSGTVLEVEDPDSTGRVKIDIPGVARTSWAEPVGGGKDRRGWFDVPEVGADVWVMFVEGLIDQAVYWPGAWGQNEAPPAGDYSPSERPLVTGIETARHLITLDRRAGQEVLRLEDKESGAVVSITDEVVVTGARVVIGDDVELAGGGAGAARVGDEVTVTIPAGIFLVVGPGGTPVPSPVPVTVTGTITAGSSKVTVG